MNWWVVEWYLVAVLLISNISCFNNQYNATNLNNLITANSQLAAELGPAQPQLVFFNITNSPSSSRFKLFQVVFKEFWKLNFWPELVQISWSIAYGMFSWRKILVKRFDSKNFKLKWWDKKGSQVTFGARGLKPYLNV